MKIDFKRIMLWLLGTSLICLGISFFLFRQAGIGPSDFGNPDSFTGGGYTKGIEDSMGFGDKTFESVEIKTVSVPVEINATDGEPRVDLQGTFKASKEEFMPYLDVSSTDGRLLVEVKHPKGIFAGAYSSDSLLSVYIPEAGLKEIRVETVSGNINTGPFETESASLKSVSGGINAERLSLSKGVFQTTSGKIRVGSLSGQILSKTTSGNMDLHFESLDDTVYLESISGNIHVSTSGNAAFTLKTDTVSGELSSKIPMTIRGGKDDNLLADIGEGGPMMEIKTVSGSMVVQ